MYEDGTTDTICSHSFRPKKSDVEIRDESQAQGEGGEEMSFTDQKPFIVEKGSHFFNLRFCGVPSFCCGICCKDFCAGDTVRWVYANDTPKTSGNFFVCDLCVGERHALLEKRKEMLIEFKRLSKALGMIR